MVSIEILHSNIFVAQISYRPGFYVEIKVGELFKTKKVVFRVCHHQNLELVGNWPEALDKYFNESTFESRSDFLPHESARAGCAREHRSLFLAAARALEKNLTPLGYEFKVSFE